MSTATELSREEMHALIAERIEGWSWYAPVHPRADYDMWRKLSPVPSPWLTPCAADELESLVVYYGDPDFPNYSADLNMCARAEAKIAERGLFGEYLYHLGEALALPPEAVIDVWGIEASAEYAFAAVNAPAEARVRAMAALIRSMEAK